MTRIRCEECGAVFESNTDMILCPICQNFEDNRQIILESINNESE
jgi:uncharacterized Zn finger protein (UPF0148 family)